MERNSKTVVENFWEFFPLETLVENPVKAIEAIGWLRCTKQYVPSLEDWIDSTIDFIIKTL